MPISIEIEIFPKNQIEIHQISKYQHHNSTSLKVIKL